jgi:phosphate acetyltransferase
VKIISPIKSEHYEDYVNTYYELRKKKNVTLGMAKDLMEDGSILELWFIKDMQTEWFLEQPIRRNIRFYQHYNLKQNPICGFFDLLCLEDRVSVFGDCAINQILQNNWEIAISSADSSLAFGIEPKIAMLSYSSGASGKGMKWIR